MSRPVPLQPGRYYRIFSRGNNREDLFIEPRNYPYFLRLYERHLTPIAETYAYCLLRNHFHLLVRVKQLPDLEASAGLKPPSQHFANFLNAYARAINRAYGRTGALFQRPFGRSQVDDQAYFRRLIVYIHQNPQRHRLAAEFQRWRHSSYLATLADQPAWLARAPVLTWFGGTASFLAAHGEEMRHHDVAEWIGRD